MFLLSNFSNFLIFFPKSHTHHIMKSIFHCRSLIMLLVNSNIIQKFSSWVKKKRTVLPLQRFSASEEIWKVYSIYSVFLKSVPKGKRRFLLLYLAVLQVQSIDSVEISMATLETDAPGKQCQWQHYKYHTSTNFRNPSSN